MSFSLSEVLYYGQLYLFFFFLSSLRVDAHSFNFDKFRDTAPLKQIKTNKPGGGGGVYLHTTPTSSEW